MIYLFLILEQIIKLIIITVDGFLETHDFLQPLERVGKKDGNKFAAPPASASAVVSLSQSQSHRMTQAEGMVITTAQSSGSDKNDENSNCSSYTGSGFSLWEESAVMKGKTGKENIAGNKRVISGISYYVQLCFILFM